MKYLLLVVGISVSFLILIYFLSKPVDQKLTLCTDESTQRIEQMQAQEKLSVQETCNFILNEEHEFQACLSNVKQSSPLLSGIVINYTKIMNRDTGLQNNTVKTKCESYLNNL
jgi:hypothetical protein